MHALLRRRLTVALSICLLAPLCQQRMVALAQHSISAINIQSICAGPDGNTWFADRNDNIIGRITHTGAITLFPLAATAQPSGIAPGPGGDLYFSQAGAATLGRITPGGAISYIQLPSYAGRDFTTVRGPGNTVWFANTLYVGELLPDGKVTVHAQPQNNMRAIQSLAVTANGHIWFGSQNRPSGRKSYDIYEMTPAGKITAHPLPAHDNPAQWLAVGPDGDIWYAMNGLDRVGRMTPSGKTTEFALPKTYGWPAGITSGPGGAVWVAQSAMNVIYGVTSKPLAGSIDRISISGKVHARALTTTSYVTAIGAGGDGNVWFSDSPRLATGSVDRLTPGGTLSRFSYRGTFAHPVAIPISVAFSPQVVHGDAQTVAIATAPDARITVKVVLPDGSTFLQSGTADSQGHWSYTWLVQSTTTGTATIALTVHANGATRHFTKRFEVT